MTAVLTWTAARRRYELLCCYEQRALPKGYGFRWDSDRKVWWTAVRGAASNARAGVDICEPPVLARLAGQPERTVSPAESVEHSRALRPERLAYLEDKLRTAVSIRRIERRGAERLEAKRPGSLARAFPRGGRSEAELRAHFAQGDRPAWSSDVKWSTYEMAFVLDEEWSELRLRRILRVLGSMPKQPWPSGAQQVDAVVAAFGAVAGVYDVEAPA